MADTRKRQHGRAHRSKDLYRKARRAARKIKRFKMKGKVATEYMRLALASIFE